MLHERSDTWAKGRRGRAGDDIAEAARLQSRAEEEGYGFTRAANLDAFGGSCRRQHDIGSVRQQQNSGVPLRIQRRLWLLSGEHRRLQYAAGTWLLQQWHLRVQSGIWWASLRSRNANAGTDTHTHPHADRHTNRHSEGYTDTHTDEYT